MTKKVSNEKPEGLTRPAPPPAPPPKKYDPNTVKLFVNDKVVAVPEIDLWKFRTPRLNSILIGHNNTCNHNNCILIGRGLTSTADNQIRMGNSEVNCVRKMTQYEFDQLRKVLGVY